MEEANAFYRSIGFTPTYETVPVTSPGGIVTLTTIYGTKEPTGPDSYEIREVAVTEEVSTDSERVDFLPKMGAVDGEGNESP
jgi:hypothetical protein